MTDVAAGLRLHPTGCCPPTRSAASSPRRLYGAVRNLPTVSPHGHVDSRVLLATSRSGTRRRCTHWPVFRGTPVR